MAADVEDIMSQLGKVIDDPDVFMQDKLQSSQIGVLCAILEELRVIREILDEETKTN